MRQYRQCVIAAPLCRQVGAVGGPGRAASKRLVRFDNIVERFIGRVGTDIKHDLGFFHGADPVEFAQIEFDLFDTGKLLHVAVRLKHPQRKSVCLGHSVEIIRRREAARAGHILNDHIRIARNVLRHVLREQPGPEVI